jgi:hypothetical protein
MDRSASHPNPYVRHSNKLLTKLPHLSHTKEALLRGHIENFERFPVLAVAPASPTDMGPARKPMPLPLHVVPLQTPVEWVPRPPLAETAAANSSKGLQQQELADRIVGEMNVSEAASQLAAMVKVLMTQELLRQQAKAAQVSSTAQYLADLAERRAKNYPPQPEKGQLETSAKSVGTAQATKPKDPRPARVSVVRSSAAGVASKFGSRVNVTRTDPTAQVHKGKHIASKKTRSHAQPHVAAVTAEEEEEEEEEDDNEENGDDAHPKESAGADSTADISITIPSALSSPPVENAGLTISPAPTLPVQARQALEKASLAMKAIQDLRPKKLGHQPAALVATDVVISNDHRLPVGKSQPQLATEEFVVGSVTIVRAQSPQQPLGAQRSSRKHPATSIFKTAFADVGFSHPEMSPITAAPSSARAPSPALTSTAVCIPEVAAKSPASAGLRPPAIVLPQMDEASPTLPRDHHYSPDRGGLRAASPLRYVDADMRAPSPSLHSLGSAHHSSETASAAAAIGTCFPHSPRYGMSPATTFLHSPKSAKPLLTPQNRELAADQRRGAAGAASSHEFLLDEADPGGGALSGGGGISGGTTTIPGLSPRASTLHAPQKSPVGLSPTVSRVEMTERPTLSRTSSSHKSGGPSPVSVGGQHLSSGSADDDGTGGWSIQEVTASAGESFDHRKSEVGDDHLLLGVPSLTIQEASVREDNDEPMPGVPSPAAGGLRTSHGSSPRLLSRNYSCSGTPKSPSGIRRIGSMPSLTLPPAAASAKSYSSDPMILAGQIERDRLLAAYEPEYNALKEKLAELSAAVVELEKAITQSQELEESTAAQQRLLESLDAENESIVRIMRSLYENITVCKDVCAANPVDSETVGLGEPGAGSEGSTQEHGASEEQEAEREPVSHSRSGKTQRSQSHHGPGPEKQTRGKRAQSHVVDKKGGDAPNSDAPAALRGGAASPSTAGFGIGQPVKLSSGGIAASPSSPARFGALRSPSPSLAAVASASPRQRSMGGPSAPDNRIPTGPPAAKGWTILRGGRTAQRVLERKRKEEDAELLKLLADCRDDHAAVQERFDQDTQILVDRGRDLLAGDFGAQAAAGAGKAKRGKKAAAAAQSANSTLQNALLTALADTSGAGSSSSSGAFVSEASIKFTDGDYIKAAVLESIGLEIAEFQAQRDYLRATNASVEAELTILLGQLHILAGAGSEDETFEMARELLNIDDDNIAKPEMPPADSTSTSGHLHIAGVGSFDLPDPVEDYDVTDRAGFREMRNAATQVCEHDIVVALKALGVGGLFSTDNLEQEAGDDIYRHERLLSKLIHHMMVAVSNITEFHSNLEVECTCKQCLKLFTDPRTLWPCGHTFCGSCLPQLEDGDGNLVCSECGAVGEMGHIAHPTMELMANYQRMNLSAAATLGSSSPSSAYGREKSIYATLEQLANDLAAAKDGYGFDYRSFTPAPKSPAATPRKIPSQAFANFAAGSPPASPSPLPLLAGGPAVSPRAEDFSAPPSASSSPGALVLAPTARRGTMQFMDLDAA